MSSQVREGEKKSKEACMSSQVTGGNRVKNLAWFPSDGGRREV
jgi:hypothetical protein